MLPDTPTLRQCLQTEEKGLRTILRWLHEQGWAVVRISNGSPLSETLQKSVGDLIANDPKGRLRCMEVKVEERSTGNLFLERWSNRRRLTPGWLPYSQADLLLYFFLDAAALYTCDFHRLKQWAYAHNGVPGQPRIEQFPLVRQRQHEQKNDTWGYLVPIAALAPVGLQYHHLSLVHEDDT
jgi:hypothetical protein